MEKAIDIKRRAQRCLQAGDLDGALVEYEKLTRAQECEPIHFVLRADLLFKKGDAGEAARCYLQSVDAYAGVGLYKNAIAVCKKMARLALSPAVVLQRLAELHALDGLKTEAALYYQEFAEHHAHEQRFREAADTMRQAFVTLPEDARVLERASEWLLEAGDAPAAAAVLREASEHSARRGQADDAARLRARADTLHPEAAAAPAVDASTVAPAPVAEPPAAPDGARATPAARTAETDGLESRPVFVSPAARDAIPVEVVPAAAGRPDSPAGAAGPAGGPDLAAIEALLRQAAERFRAGERESAGNALVEAAQAYEAIERLESAAAIYRSLGRSVHATPEVLGLWLRNCELRGAAEEAAEVACGLGDRALNEGDLEGGREWFTRALRHVPDHELATRRIQKLGPSAAGPGPAGSRPPAAASPGADGRIEVAVGRAQAVTLDLGALIAEFQRGLEPQLSGDSQSHYDLGMTYREMGLLDQAVSCFRDAARDPAFRVRATEMVGRCLLDQGRFDDAIAEFGRGVTDLEGTGEAAVCLRFHLGLACEVAGRIPEALAEFERVYALQPSFPDVAQKIRLLRQTPERV